MKGVHILADFENCSNKQLLLDKSLLKLKLKKLIQKTDFKIIKECSYKFRGKGITEIFLITESHIAIHTWPENNSLNLDIFTCNIKKNNKATRLFEDMRKLFLPKKIKKRIIKR
jgi:spermidine synthase|tara:strand:- start:3702 stop:4043 length:342 start_codon:yes stop_codon:yes gene_type:complete